MQKNINKRMKIFLSIILLLVISEISLLAFTPKIKVSVIIPVYNAELYIGRCLDSILNQTLKDIEIIAVDDESTDNSLNILNEYATKDSRIKVYHKKNGGVGSARNLGLEKANGEFIGFVDSDDIVSEDFFEILYNTAKNYKTDIAATSDVWGINYEKQTIEDKSFETGLRKTNDLQSSIVVYRNMQAGWQWNKIYKRKFLKKYNIKSTLYNTLAEDMYFTTLTMMHTENIATVHNVRYWWTHREDSECRKKISQPKDDLFLMYQDLDQIAKKLDKNKAKVWQKLIEKVRKRDVKRTIERMDDDIKEIFLKKERDYFAKDIE